MDNKTIQNRVSSYRKTIVKKMKAAGIYDPADYEMIIKDIAIFYKQFLKTQNQAEDAELIEDHQLAMQYHRQSLSYYKQVQESLKILSITTDQKVKRGEGREKATTLADALKGLSK